MYFLTHLPIHTFWMHSASVSLGEGEAATGAVSGLNEALQRATGAATDAAEDGDVIRVSGPDPPRSRSSSPENWETQQKVESTTTEYALPPDTDDFF